MKTKVIILASYLFTLFQLNAQTRIVGADISLLPEYENAGAKYKDENGEPISNLLEYLYVEGMRCMRVRLFVDPSAFPNNDPNACQDLAYILPLCKEIVDNGYGLMLDFHYSDTWADPAAQWIPKSWEGLSDEELYVKIYDYTKETLQTLKAEGIMPSYIQPGNEISYGMLWSPYGAPSSEQKKTFIGNDANWSRLGHLLDNAIRACREICPDAEIVIHTERVGEVNVQNNFYNKMKELNIDYDIIGLSYYPYFHGNMSVLKTALSSLEYSFPEKDIMIVETGYPYQWEVPGSNQHVDYPYSSEGQAEFATQLVNTLEDFKNMKGLFWWWLEYNAFGTNLSGWYNAPLFDSRTGKATPALKIICSFGSTDASVESIERKQRAGEDLWIDMTGCSYTKPMHRGLYIHEGEKVMIRK